MTSPIVNDTNGAILQIIYPYFKNAELVEIFNFSEGSIRRLVNNYIDTPHTRSEVLAMEEDREIPYEVYRDALAIAETFGGQVPELLQCGDLIDADEQERAELAAEIEEAEQEIQENEQESESNNDLEEGLADDIDFEPLLSAALTSHSITTTLHAPGAAANIPARLADMEEQSGNTRDYATEIEEAEQESESNDDLEDDIDFEELFSEDATETETESDNTLETLFSDTDIEELFDDITPETLQSDEQEQERTNIPQNSEEMDTSTMDWRELYSRVRETDRTNQEPVESETSNEEDRPLAFSDEDAVFTADIMDPDRTIDITEHPEQVLPDFQRTELNSLYPKLREIIDTVKQYGPLAQLEVRLSVAVDYEGGLEVYFETVEDMQEALLNGVEGYHHIVKINIRYVGDEGQNTEIDTYLESVNRDAEVTAAGRIAYSTYDEIIIRFN